MSPLQVVGVPQIQIARQRLVVDLRDLEVLAGEGVGEVQALEDALVLVSMALSLGACFRISSAHLASGT